MLKQGQFHTQINGHTKILHVDFKIKKQVGFEDVNNITGQREVSGKLHNPLFSDLSNADLIGIVNQLDDKNKNKRLEEIVKDQYKQIYDLENKRR